MPVALGVAPNQPSPAIASSKVVNRYAGIFLVILVIIQAVSAFTARHTEVLRQTFRLEKPHVRAAEAFAGTVKSESFTLPGIRTAVEIQLSASVRNHWFSIDGALVNELNDTQIQFAQGVEYYFGTEGGESWSEGNSVSSIVLSQVPAGTYHLLFEPSSSDTSGAVEYKISVLGDVQLWSNFLEAALIILLFPAFAFFRKRNFEVQRWSESDYSPYNSVQRSDDE